MKKIVFLNIGIFFLLIFTLEICIRLLNLANPLGYKDNLYNNSKNLVLHNPNIISKVFGKIVFTDKNGFRVPKQNFEYKKNFQSILILGDSTSFGSGVIEEDTFIGVLRQKINSNFYNASVAGHSLKDYISLIKRYSQNITFNKIVIFLNIDDIKNIKINKNIEKSNVLKKNLNYIDKLKAIKIVSNLNIFLRDKSTLYVYLKSIVSKPQSRVFKDIHKDYLEKKRVNLYKNDLNRLINYLPNVLDKEIYFVLLPFEFQTRKENCNEKYLLPQKVIKEVMNSSNIKYFDFTKHFCESTNPSKLFLPFDPAHLSKKGNQFVSNLIMENSSVLRD